MSKFTEALEILERTKPLVVKMIQEMKWETVEYARRVKDWDAPDEEEIVTYSEMEDSLGDLNEALHDISSAMKRIKASHFDEWIKEEKTGNTSSGAARHLPLCEGEG